MPTDLRAPRQLARASLQTANEAVGAWCAAVSSGVFTWQQRCGWGACAKAVRNSWVEPGHPASPTCWAANPRLSTHSATTLTSHLPAGESSPESAAPSEALSPSAEWLRRRFCLEGVPAVDIDALDLHKVAGAGKVAGAELGAQRSTHRVTSNLEIGQQKTQSTIATDSSNLSLNSRGRS